MVQRRKESGIDIFLTAPWWVSAVVAVAGFAAFQWILPALTATSLVGKVFGPIFKPFGYFAGVILGLIAVVSFFRQRRVSGDIRSETATRYVPRSIPPGTPTVDQVTKTWEDMMATAPAPVSMPEPKPTAWSLELLQQIEWKRFEQLCAAYFERIGFRAEVADFGADGGVDIRLYVKDATHPNVIVQCKSWRTYKVGVKEVRELFGVMSSLAVNKSVFVTSSVFTKEAKEFAEGIKMHLLDGCDLLAKIETLPGTGATELLTMATAGEYMTPSCPNCGTKMVERQGKAKEPFWGCPTYPKCRSTMQMAKV